MSDQGVAADFGPAFDGPYDGGEALDIDAIAGQLTSCGFVTVENFLPAVLLASLDHGCDDSEAMHFSPARIGKGKDRRRDGLIRGDVIRWLDDTREADHLYLTLMEGLRVSLNERLCLGLFSYEGHYAIYGIGSHYQRHLDAHAGHNNRRLSTVVYLDSAWTPSDGGELVLHGTGENPTVARILPQPGLMVMFLSEEFPHDFAAFARQVDLAILGQPRDGDPLIGQYALVERCLFASGRPVMIAPAQPAEIALDGTIVAAWDGSAEAARAFNDALTFLKPAKRVVLLVGVMDGATEKGTPPTDDMVAHLTRHGVNVEVVRVPAGEGDIGRLLLSQAKKEQADMIVMGAFHHSRWREFILGGVTLTMLEEATIPLFMAH